MVQNQIKPGYYPDGAGLYLQVKTAAESGRVSRSWLLQYNHNQRPTRMGLGPVRNINPILLCHKSSFALGLARPQQGHCPRRAMSA